LRRSSETTETSDTERAVDKSGYGRDVTESINSAYSEITTAQVNDTTVSRDIVGGSQSIGESSDTTLVKSTLESIAGGGRGRVQRHISVTGETTRKVRLKLGGKTGSRGQGGSITNSKVTTHFLLIVKDIFFSKKNI